MNLLATTVIKPSGWVLNLASGARSLTWAIAVVGAFSIVTATGALLTAPLPEPEPGMDGVVRVGVALGLFLGIGAGFLLWLYLAVGTYLVLKAVSRPPGLAELVRLAGISLVFPLAGRTVSLVVQASAPVWLPAAAYLLGVGWGVAVLSKAIATSTGGRWFSAALGVLLPILLTQMPWLVSKLL